MTSFWFRWLSQRSWYRQRDVGVAWPFDYIQVDLVQRVEGRIYAKWLGTFSCPSPSNIRHPFGDSLGLQFWSPLFSSLLPEPPLLLSLLLLNLSRFRQLAWLCCSGSCSTASATALLFTIHDACIRQGFSLSLSQIISSWKYTVWWVLKAE